MLKEVYKWLKKRVSSSLRTQRLKTQKRFAHFLRGYRKRQGLTQKQLASQLGYTELHYRKLESESADNTVIKSFDTLGFFAKLQNMTTVDFTSYIEQNQ